MSNITLKQKPTDILSFSYLSPSTEDSIQKLKMKDVKDFNEIKTLTEEIMYIEYMLCREKKNIIYKNKERVFGLEKKLSNLIKPYDIPDKSYPFRHRIIITTKYDELESNIGTKLKRLLKIG